MPAVCATRTVTVNSIYSTLFMFFLCLHRLGVTTNRHIIR